MLENKDKLETQEWTLVIVFRQNHIPRWDAWALLIDNVSMLKLP